MQTMELSNEKCQRHGQRYCPEPGCCTPLIPTAPPPVVPDGFEDRLVGRPTSIPVPASSVPVPPVAPVVVRPAPASTPSQIDSPANELVRATKTYAECVEAAKAALGLVTELEKRLSFAREEAIDAIGKRDTALETVRSLVGEQKGKGNE